MKLSSLLKAAGAATLAWAFTEPWLLRIRRHTVTLPGLPAEAEGFRIVQISDLHAGAITPRVLVRRIIAASNAERPDLVALTGDFVSRRNSYLKQSGARTYARPLDEYAEGLAEDLKDLRAPRGLFAVPGNHDHFERSFDYLAGILERAGVRSIVNEALELPNGMWLGGTDDRRAGYPNVNETFARVPRDAPQVILTHNPRLAWLLRERNALILSGHTHGGQIRLPGYLHSPVDMTGSSWVLGFYRLDVAQLYVSSGVGAIGVPLRLGVPPEIAVFTLTGGAL